MDISYYLWLGLAAVVGVLIWKWQTGLTHAVIYGDVKRVRAIFNSRPEIIGDKKLLNDLLIDAAGGDSVEMVEFLLSNGADVNARWDDGKTPLHCAVSTRAIMELLLSKGADLEARDKAGATPLYEALQGGDMENARWLLEKGADPSVKNKAGQTPLDLAEAAGKKEIAALLKKKTA